MNREYTASCAVCGGPGEPECPCEGQKLQQCIDLAEKAWIESWVGKTREWVTNNAINAVTTLFNKKKEARKVMFREQVLNIPYFPMYQAHRGQPPLDPRIIADIQRRLADADLRHKQGIDYDWKQCVIRYPDVLAHFYNQIKIPLPSQPESPFTQALAGGGAQRPPSVVNHPPPPASTVGMGMGIDRAATAPPKKSRRTSKVNMDTGGMDVMAYLSHQLDNLNRPAPGGRTKAATPAPQASTPGPKAMRPGNRRRESKEYSMPRGMFNPPPPPPPPPPHVPQPPPGHSVRNSFYDLGH